MRNRLTVEPHTLAQWRRLARSAPPVLAPEIFVLSARLVRGASARLERAYSGGTLVAALPTLHRGRTLHGLRADHAPRVDLVGDAGALPAMWQEMYGARDWDVLDIGGVSADSPLATTLAELARADGCRVRVSETHRAPWFEIPGIEQRLHRRFRGDMRRLDKHLGGVQLERITRYDRQALQDFFRLEAAAWKGTAGTAIACDARLVRFYAALFRSLAARGRASISFLLARGRRIAVQLALEDATTYQLLKVGYDPAFAHFGPGQLLVRETAADAERRGLARYDMMGTQTPWKAKWTKEARAIARIVVYAPSARGRLWHFVREVARPIASRAVRLVAGTPSQAAPRAR